MSSLRRKMTRFYRISCKKCLFYSLVFWCFIFAYIKTEESRNSIRPDDDPARNLIRRWQSDSDVKTDFFDSPKWTRSYPLSQLRTWEDVPPDPTFTNRPGDGGVPIILKDKDVVRRAESLKSKHRLNLVVSDLAPLNRTLPDYRDPECLERQYPRRLPQASVIIVFHNEPPSTLLRTAASVINRSPKGLIKEIVLVDDASHLPELKEPLEKYVSELSVPTFILRLTERQGLIRARLAGADRATGSVLVFFDAHIEVTQGWLQPLLTEIVKDRTTVAIPVIDDIDDEDFSYQRIEDQRIRGGIDWKLFHAWIGSEPLLPGQRSTDAFPTPTMIGCAFAIDREYFYASGAYDSEMMIWGGENIEMSIRVWLCGGSLLAVPCSRVGHVYRTSTPHTIPGSYERKMKTVSINNARLAEVWLDEFKDFYYYMNPGSAELEKGNLDERFKFKRNCHDFKWFLRNVYPDSVFPFEQVYVGEIRESQSMLCLDSLGSKGSKLSVRLCHGLGGYQTFIFAKSGRIKTGTRCVGHDGVNITVDSCVLKNRNQIWKYEDGRFINSGSSNFCLTFRDSSVGPKSTPVSILKYLSDVVKESLEENMVEPTLKPCDQTISGQKWILHSSAKWEKKKRSHRFPN